MKKDEEEKQKKSPWMNEEKVKIGVCVIVCGFSRSEYKRINKILTNIMFVRLGHEKRTLEYKKLTPIQG